MTSGIPRRVVQVVYLVLVAHIVFCNFPYSGHHLKVLGSKKENNFIINLRAFDRPTYLIVDHSHNYETFHLRDLLNIGDNINIKCHFI